MEVFVANRYDAEDLIAIYVGSGKRLDLVERLFPSCSPDPAPQCRSARRTITVTTQKRRKRALEMFLENISSAQTLSLYHFLWGHQRK